MKTIEMIRIQVMVQVWNFLKSHGMNAGLDMDNGNVFIHLNGGTLVINFYTR